MQLASLCPALVRRAPMISISEPSSSRHRLWQAPRMFLRFTFCNCRRYARLFLLEVESQRIGSAYVGC